jgi:hypothetical protein
MGIMVQALTALIIAPVFLLAGYLWGKRRFNKSKNRLCKGKHPSWVEFFPNRWRHFFQIFQRI